MQYSFFYPAHYHYRQFSKTRKYNSFQMIWENSNVPLFCTRPTDIKVRSITVPWSNCFQPHLADNYPYPLVVHCGCCCSFWILLSVDKSVDYKSTAESDEISLLKIFWTNNAFGAIKPILLDLLVKVLASKWNRNMRRRDSGNADICFNFQK